MLDQGQELPPVIHVIYVICAVQTNFRRKKCHVFHVIPNVYDFIHMNYVIFVIFYFSKKKIGHVIHVIHVIFKVWNQGQEHLLVIHVIYVIGVV